MEGIRQPRRRAILQHPLLAGVLGLIATRRGVEAAAPPSREKFEKAKRRSAYEPGGGTRSRRANNHLGAAFVPPPRPAPEQPSKDERREQSKRDIAKYARSIKSLGMRRAAQRRLA